MPRPLKGRRLGAGPSHQKLILSNMAASLIEGEHVTTTLHKAKVLRPYVEKMITKARKGGIHNRRTVNRRLRDERALAKLFGEIGPRYLSRNGGYTRILKLGERPGDGAPMARIELV